MDARQRKLFELRLKLNQSRKANQSAVVAEKRRKDAPEEEKQMSRKRAAEGGAAATQEKLVVHGIDPSKAYLLESMDAAAAGYSKKKGARKGDDDDGDLGAHENLYHAFKRRAEALPRGAAQPASAEGDADALAYGTAPELPAANVERMVADLTAAKEARAKMSRRRKHYEDADIDSINDRNAHFNRKLERVYGAYTTEIKGNLERGTAL